MNTARSARSCLLVAGAAMLFTAPAWAGAGTGFAEALRFSVPASQAGSAGVPLERYQNSDMEVRTDQAWLTAGTRWVGLGAEAVLFSALRIGVEGIDIRTGGVPGATEKPDGTFEAETGDLEYSESGGRGILQLGYKDPADRYRFIARGELTVIEQDTAGVLRRGKGVTGHGFGSLNVTGDWHAFGWVVAGPFGKGGGGDFASSMRGGAGGEKRGGLGLAGGEEGVRLGVEAERLGEGKLTIGAGLAYWFGGADRDGRGVRVILRTGFRSTPDSISPAAARFGLGVVFRDEAGVGWGADYAYVPFGELGTLHYLGAVLKLGGGFLKADRGLPGGDE